MQKKFIDILDCTFPQIDRCDIEQAVLIAELRVGQHKPRLISRMVKCACMNKIKMEARHSARYPSYDAGGSWLITEDSVTALLMKEQEEWDETIGKLPRRVKKLVQIAQEEADAFASLNPHGELWTRQALSKLRHAIKHHFIDWEWNHSENGYYKARRTLVEALRRNKRK